MVGTWFGRGQPEDKESMYIDRMRADGSWRGEYRTCLKGKSAAGPDAGRPLDAVGRHAFARVDTVNGMRAPRTDLYKMLAHTATTQKYLSLGWNYPYTPQREPDDFKMPSCLMS